MIARALSQSIKGHFRVVNGPELITEYAGRAEAELSKLIFTKKIYIKN
jgi:AAA+ superfamily predicted ATPase